MLAKLTQSAAPLGAAALERATHAVLVLIAWGARNRKPEDVTEHTHCVPMMRTSAAVLEIMPTPERAHQAGGDSSNAATSAPKAP